MDSSGRARRDPWRAWSPSAVDGRIAAAEPRDCLGPTEVDPGSSDRDMLAMEALGDSGRPAEGRTPSGRRQERKGLRGRGLTPRLGDCGRRLLGVAGFSPDVGIFPPQGGRLDCTPSARSSEESHSGRSTLLSVAQQKMGCCRAAELSGLIWRLSLVFEPEGSHPGSGCARVTEEELVRQPLRFAKRAIPSGCHRRIGGRRLASRSRCRASVADSDICFRCAGHT